MQYSAKQAGTSSAPTDVNFEIAYSIKMADLTTYQLSSSHHSDSTTGALVNRGADRGIAGEDCCIIETNNQPQRYINVEGIDSHVMSKWHLVTAGVVSMTNQGPVILVMHQYAHSGKGHLIHSSPQLEWNGIDVDDKSKCVGGKQCLQTLNRFHIPINITLPYIELRPFTDSKWNDLPHVFLTQEEDWDPSVLDLEQSDDPEWYSQSSDPLLLNPSFDIEGNYHHRVAYKSDVSATNQGHGEIPLRSILIHEQDIYFDAEESLQPLDDIESALDRCVYKANLHGFVQPAETNIGTQPVDDATVSTHHGPCKVTATAHDYEELHPHFAWLPTKVIEKTFAHMTQYARMPHNTILWKRFKAPNPALNVHCQNEPLASDTIE